jgi:hypothetical protein
MQKDDAESVRLVLDWAASRVNVESLRATFDVIWRLYMDQQWQTGDFDRIWRLFADLDRDREPNSIAGGDAGEAFDIDDSRSPLPPFVMKHGDAMDMRPPGETTILFMMPEHTLRKEQDRLIPSQPEDMTYNYRKAAKQAGHRAHYIDSSRFSYEFGLFTGLEHLMEVDDAIDLACEIKPDIVALDGNCNSRRNNRPH